MNSDQSLPRVLKVVDTASLLNLEERAVALGLSQRLEPAWVAANTAPDEAHYLWPVMLHDLSHRPDGSPQLRCELLITLPTGEHVLSLLDVLPDDFARRGHAGQPTSGQRAQRQGLATPGGWWLFGAALTGVASR
ncbi:hypothetical protein ACWD62_27710 [Streptomyces sp. NPDC005146]